MSNICYNLHIFKHKGVKMIITINAKEIYKKVKAECESNPRSTRTRFEKGDAAKYDREYILTPNGSYIFYFNAMHENNYKQVLNGESADYVASVEVA